MRERDGSKTRLGFLDVGVWGFIGLEKVEEVGGEDMAKD